MIFFSRNCPAKYNTFNTWLFFKILHTYSLIITLVLSIGFFRGVTYIYQNLVVNVTNIVLNMLVRCFIYIKKELGQRVRDFNLLSCKLYYEGTKVKVTSKINRIHLKVKKYWQFFDLYITNYLFIMLIYRFIDSLESNI